jgi:hypothetical protein
MGYKLTGNMGYTSNWADALEKCVINGTETAVNRVRRRISTNSGEIDPLMFLF